MDTLPLTLVIITLNEERLISRCMRSVPFAQEIIVVDSLSTDKTCEIAESHGAKVIKQKFLGYRAQKQFALEQATTPWVLSLDADEELTAELGREIKNLFSKEMTYNAYRMPRLSFHLHRFIRHGGWYPDYQTRLLKRGHGRWAGQAVHEYLEVDSQVGTLKNNIAHAVFKDFDEQITTNNEFSSLGAQDIVAQNKGFSLFKMIAKPLSKFIECYIWKLGFLDGAPGFIIALSASQSVFLKYAKVWELVGSK